MKRGFTIVELIVVLTAISILASIVGFGSVSMMNRSKNGEAVSEITVIKAALEKYYAENNEYPSAALLAGGGDGRTLTTQYNTIATTLRVNVNVLNTGRYKFMPCANGSNYCCTINGAGECVIPDTDDKFIVYMTRSSADVTANSARTFKSPSSGCLYTLPSGTANEDRGYSAYYLAYFNPVESDTLKKWRWYSSDRGKNTRGAWCTLNQYEDQV